MEYDPSHTWWYQPVLHTTVGHSMSGQWSSDTISQCSLLLAGVEATSQQPCLQANKKLKIGVDPTGVHLRICCI